MYTSNYGRTRIRALETRTVQEEIIIIYHGTSKKDIGRQLIWDMQDDVITFGIPSDCEVKRKKKKRIIMTSREGREGCEGRDSPCLNASPRGPRPTTL